MTGTSQKGAEREERLCTPVALVSDEHLLNGSHLIPREELRTDAGSWKGLCLVQNNTGDMASGGASCRGWCQAHPKLLYILSQVAVSIHTRLSLIPGTFGKWGKAQATKVWGTES